MHVGVMHSGKCGSLGHWMPIHSRQEGSVRLNGRRS